MSGSVVKLRDAGAVPGVGGPQTEVAIDDDGGVTIRDFGPARPVADDDSFDANLAKRIDAGAFSSLASDLIDAIDQDLAGRAGWISNYNEGLSLLGLKINEVSSAKAQKRNISTVTHPLLLRAVVKAQGLARAELLPAAGPCKVRLRGSDTGGLDDLALSLEQDVNAYLTVGAPEYVPEMDRGLFNLFFCGNLFKKVHEHPLRRRPVSEVVEADDLIVPQSATDLDTSPRITHRARLSKVTIRRMQLFGDWLDVPLGAAGTPLMDYGGVKAKQASITGMQGTTTRPEDEPFTIYEITTDIDFAQLGIDVPDAPEGLPLPARIVIEKESRTVLGLYRSWRPGDAMFRRRHGYVHYGMVPAFGFLCLGFVHLLGNDARALTAAWRLITDAGMFANFPGGVKLKGARFSTNEIAPAPGEWPDIDGNGADDIRKIMMPMPYKEASPVFISFIEAIEKEAEALAGTVEIESGEGRTNIPVGTMLAMVEQSSQLTSVVHKRLHTSQAQELMLLKDCIAANPESITAVIPNPSRQWVGALEFGSVDLIPASDPNVPSQVHRAMLATAMVQMASMNPDIYDKMATHRRAWRAVGVMDTNDFLIQKPPQPPQGDPAAQAAAGAQQVKAHADMLKAQTDMEDSRRKAATEAVQTQAQHQSDAMALTRQQSQQQTELALAQVQQQTEQMRLAEAIAKATPHPAPGPTPGVPEGGP